MMKVYVYIGQMHRKKFPDVHRDEGTSELIPHCECN
jgi:hypothetical protein